MKRVILAAVLGVSAITGFAGTADAHWHHGCGYAPVRYYYPPRVVAYAPPVCYGPAYYPAPVVYPGSSVSYYGRNFALQFGF